MTPETHNIFSDKKVRYSVISFGLLSAVIILAWLLTSLFKPATLNITPTSITLDDGIAVSGDKVITYNGSSFIEISPSEGTTKVLHTPQTRFPSIEGINYAPGVGALLTFSGNIMATPVFDYKIEHDTFSPSVGITEDSYQSGLTSGNNYTWFLDFNKNTLVHVMNEEIDSRLAYYNTVDKVFYFTHGNSHDGYNELKSYDISTQKIKTVSDELGFENIKNIKKCDNSTCIIGSKDTSTDIVFLSKISSSGKISEVAEIRGDILPTPDESTFAYLTEPDNVIPEDEDESDVPPESSSDGHNHSHDEYGAGIVGYQKIDIVNISNNEKQEYSGIYRTGGVIGQYDDHFYYMSGTSGTYQYLKRSSRDIDFDYNQKTNDFDEGFININMVSSDFALIADVDREVYIVSTDKNISVFDKADMNEVNKNVVACADKVNSGIEVRSQAEEDATSIFDVDFEIMTPDDKDFNSHIYKMNQCIGKNTENLVGYNYVYTGVSPINGKITTE